MKIIDYHAHLGWDQKTDTYLGDELLADMDQCGIEKRVVSALYGYGITEQNDAVMALVKAHPDRVIGCAVINPKERGCLDEMRRIIDSGLFKCIELDSMEHCYIPETCLHVDAIMQMAAQADLAVNVFTGWGPRTMPAQWAYYAKKYPNLRMVLLHMGTTDFGYGAIKLVAESNNLWDETSGMYEFPILRRAFAGIPENRFLFGTHYPHKFTQCSIDTFELLHLSEEFRHKLFYQNAVDFLKLEGSDV